jgi:mono/diheme cytochrome c family protein
MNNRTHSHPAWSLRKPALWASALALCASLVSAADVAENWGKHCVSCHGKDGKGETKAGRKAGSKDMTDAAYQGGLTDEKMFKALKEGIKDAGKEKMKPFGDKLTDDEIKALIAHVRGFKK